VAGYLFEAVVGRIAVGKTAMKNVKFANKTFMIPSKMVILDFLNMFHLWPKISFANFFELIRIRGLRPLMSSTILGSSNMPPETEVMTPRSFPLLRSLLRPLLK
jgi:hypothetical protein